MSVRQNFSVPFKMPISGGMYAGKMIIVQGTIPSMSQRFAVNLLTHSGDIAFHLCPRFNENRVVRNNVLNMNWGPEESHGGLPVHPGQNFDILILCETYNFKVAINGRHFCEFSHRLPFNSISNLAVDGDVIIHNVNIKEQNSFGSNNNNSNSVPYGFQPNPSYSSGGLYPSIDSYPYPPASNRSPSPNAPHFPSSGSAYPASGPAYPSAGHSLYPTQPGFPNNSHHGPYPGSPNHNSGGHSPTSHNKHGILDQAGAALAGVLGPGLLAGGMNKRSDGYGRSNLVDQAGSALAGILGGGGGLARSGTPQKGTQPHGPTSQTDILGQAGSALAGLLGGAGLARAATHGRTPQNDVLGTAGSALAGLLGGGGSTRAVTQGKDVRNPTPQNDILGTAGSALAGLLVGDGLGGRLRRATSPLPARRHTGSIFDDAGSALSGLLGGGGSSGHHNRNKLGGVLGGALGTAVAGAALTGHLNPIKATKKQLKAHKKALKYGLPLAGAGLGAYALHKGLKKGFRRSSSSSSCSSSD